MSQVFEWREAPEAEFAVIGDPVAHSLSPVMQEAALREMGLPHRYVPIFVPKFDVLEALDRLLHLGYWGVNVTVPHKAEAFGWVDHPDDFCRRVGAVNTLRMRDHSALNTDGPGFLETLAEVGLKPPARVLMLGNGGSARALAAALGDAGYALTVWGRNPDRAEALLRDLGLEGQTQEQPDPAGFDLVLNTTSASLEGTELPVDWSRASDGAVAYDLMYGDRSMPFLEGARERGLRTVDGRSLLVAQGALSMEYWLGQEVPRAPMRRAVGL